MTNTPRTLTLAQASARYSVTMDDLYGLIGTGWLNVVRRNDTALVHDHEIQAALLAGALDTEPEDDETPVPLR